MIGTVITIILGWNQVYVMEKRFARELLRLLRVLRSAGARTSDRYGDQRMAITHHVAEHDGGFGYRLGDVWSETYPDHESALTAARSAAARQQLGGEDAEISFQLPDGRWCSEHADGGDRPTTDVVDDIGPGS